MGPLLTIRGLRVKRANGEALVQGADLDVAAGQVITLLAPTRLDGAALLRGAAAPETLAELEPPAIASVSVRDAAGPAAFVPRGGGLLEDLDVARNVALAQHARGGRTDTAAALAAVELDAAAFGARGRAVASLGPAEVVRVALARALASGRSLIALEEPAEGLDPVGVRMLAQLLARIARERGVGIVLTTHDLALASGASDAVYFLSPATQKLFLLRAGDVGPTELLEPGPQQLQEYLRLAADAQQYLAQEYALRTSLPPPPAAAARAAERAPRRAGPLALTVAGAAALHALRPRLSLASSAVFARTLGRALLAPLPLQIALGAVGGFVAHAVLAAGARGTAPPGPALAARCGLVALALAPALSALLFAASGGASVAGWLRAMRERGQLLALRGLGISEERYLWAPAWGALVISALVSAAACAAAMMAGAAAGLRAAGEGFARTPAGALWALTAELRAPTSERAALVVRAAWLVAAYAFGTASIAVARGAAGSRKASRPGEALWRASASAAAAAALLVAALELASALVAGAPRWWG